MIRLTYSTGEVAEYLSEVGAAMEATQAIVASRGLVVPVKATEVLEHGVEQELAIKLGLVEFSREV